jgi:hypothetical protein
MRRPGSRWKEKSGEEILQLRALLLSDRWQDGVRRSLSPLRKPVKFVGKMEARAA